MAIATAKFINKSVANMRTRCQRILKAGGAHIREGA